jgi:hypothetical protein
MVTPQREELPAPVPGPPGTASCVRPNRSSYWPTGNAYRKRGIHRPGWEGHRALVQGSVYRPGELCKSSERAPLIVTPICKPNREREAGVAGGSTTGTYLGDAMRTGFRALGYVKCGSASG